jgi:hypothetical protein
MARFQFQIPKFLSHLKTDERGYPIPYFVAYLKGKPDFRLLDETKREICIHKKMCSVCGKKLVDRYFYFISGEKGKMNCISTDAAMHKECAEYSLEVCPHLLYEKAGRRNAGIEFVAVPDFAIMDKPEAMYLILADKYWTTVENLISYRQKKSWKYVYSQGLLKLAE